MPPRFRLSLVTGDSNIITPPENIHVQLHRPDGTVIETSSSPDWYDTGSRSLIYTCPWPDNGLGEAWVSVRFPQVTYWIEIPYGFTGNPKKHFANPVTSKGKPSLALAMKKLGKTDHIVPWLNVEYDFGEIQNGWRLLLKQTNSNHASCEIQLYDEDIKGRWDLQSPRTSVTIHDAQNDTITSNNVSISNGSYMRRIDKFKFNRYTASGRSWGTLKITVGDKTYSAIVPSSLYKSTHGNAEPHHK